MRDQAEKLREKLMNKYRQSAKTLAIVSGKGGVGKSNIAINIALLLANQEKKVLLFDFDIGMGNVHVLLGADGNKSISDFLYRDIPIEEIIYTGPNNVSYISAGNGFSNIIELDNDMVSRLIGGLEHLQNLYDYIIFDMGAGATSSNLQILLSVDDIIVITTPEPTSITDAYSMMKYISIQDSANRFFLICNRADNEKEGMFVLEKLQLTVNKFLDKEIYLLGVLPEDQHVRKAVKLQVPFYQAFPASSISFKLEKIVGKYLGKEEKMTSQHSTANRFIRKFRNFFFERQGQ
ncbi:MinD/ParA family protein [Bacillus sp. FJAT-49736]|uniref:MinD/ParA family protein n=1 Tax=Bacillus sp. FJAT-49736 TaxID=2833582 RepID=UPI001BCA1D53|nr:MinD/ParA family protein [Bacillus sp. FJAT-49736]MBS4172536.1 MinD/ParA family protein [Bacillus sp. FJAT-49736]